MSWTGNLSQLEGIVIGCWVGKSAQPKALRAFFELRRMSKKVASFRFNQKKSSRNSQQLNLTERGHPNRSHSTQAMADRCTICLDFLTTRTIGYSNCSHFFHAECLRGWFGLPCPTCRATWTRDMTQEMGRLNATPILMNRRQFFTNQRLPPPLDVVPMCHARVYPNGDLSANFAMVWTGSRREWTCMTCHRIKDAM